MTLHPSDEEAIETIDAAVFSGDTFHDPANRAYLREMMFRWERELMALDFKDTEGELPTMGSVLAVLGLPMTGTFCSVCRQPQRRAPGGDTCINGHGGAEPLPLLPKEST